MAQNIFNSVKMVKPRLNSFDLTHDHKFSCNMGQLIPCCVLEASPGDKFKIGAQSLIRFAPLVSPVMHRFDATVHYFFVPNRIVWPGWEDFITRTEVAGSVPAFPTLNISNSGSNWTPLLDHFGIPNPADNSPANEDEIISAIPLAAYQMIYNEYYRDQNLVAEVDWELNNGDNTANADLRTLRNRAWEHDYFTSALPFAQKGAAVEMPAQEVVLDPQAVADDVRQQLLDSTMTPDPSEPLGSSPTGAWLGTNATDANPLWLDPRGSLITDGTTINDLRRAVALQKWYEKNARGGTRYIEHIRAHFGVVSSHKRLQRPEYITGVKTPLRISEVLNTTGDTGAADPLPQGNMSGHGIGVIESDRAGYFFAEEHGFVIGIMSILPKTAYQQGIPKHFLKTTDAFDYFFPDFEHIGEQAIDARELYAFNTPAGNVDTFGYTPRYAEYKFALNRVSGDFRDSLDTWHAGRKFSVQPSLNANFVTMFSTETDRIFAVTTAAVQKMYVHHLNRIKAVRPMAKYGIPTF